MSGHSSHAGSASRATSGMSRPAVSTGRSSSSTAAATHAASGGTANAVSRAASAGQSRVAVGHGAVVNTSATQMQPRELRRGASDLSTYIGNSTSSGRVVTVDNPRLTGTAIMQIKELQDQINTLSLSNDPSAPAQIQALQRQINQFQAGQQDMTSGRVYTGSAGNAAPTATATPTPTATPSQNGGAVRSTSGSQGTPAGSSSTSSAGAAGSTAPGQGGTGSSGMPAATGVSAGSAPAGGTPGVSGRSGGSADQSSGQHQNTLGNPPPGLGFMELLKWYRDRNPDDPGK
jgi:hypothetical protein